MLSRDPPETTSDSDKVNMTASNEKRMMIVGLVARRDVRCCVRARCTCEVEIQSVIQNLFVSFVVKAVLMPDCLLQCKIVRSGDCLLLFLFVAKEEEVTKHEAVDRESGKFRVPRNSRHALLCSTLLCSALLQALSILAYV
jgi:hypothetical protein